MSCCEHTDRAFELSFAVCCLAVFQATDVCRRSKAKLGSVLRTIRTCKVGKWQCRVVDCMQSVGEAAYTGFHQIKPTWWMRGCMQCSNWWQLHSEGGRVSLRRREQVCYVGASHAPRWLFSCSTGWHEDRCTFPTQTHVSIEAMASLRSTTIDRHCQAFHFHGCSFVVWP